MLLCAFCSDVVIQSTAGLKGNENLEISGTFISSKRKR